MTTPLEHYEDLLDEHAIEANPQQRVVIEYLNELHQRLISREHLRKTTLGRLRRQIKPRPPVKGLYLVGSVGVGKTFLMDCFYDSLPVRKMRVHFHQFMLNIHEQLTQLQGLKNPLKIIGRRLGEQYLVICLDEFFVSNITDAMILGELMKSLFARGITLVTTSNIIPDELYKNGLQRERFLPAIALIKRHTKVMTLQPGKDFRLRELEQAGRYFYPLTQASRHRMKISFEVYSNRAPYSEDAIILFGRPIRVIRHTTDTLWCYFKDICGRPRSQKDYVALSQSYKTLLISHVPLIRPHEDGLIISFINLIDVMYDAHVRVIISAAGPIENLYTEGRMLFEFERTKSRLIEMQAREY